MMNKRLTKPHEKNIRLDAPLGLPGVPPEAAIDGGADTYIIVTDKKTAERFIDEIFRAGNSHAPLQ